MPALETFRTQRLETFLQRYAITVTATGTTMLDNGQGQLVALSTLLPQATFHSGAVDYYDTTVAPLFYGSFTDTDARNTDIFRFSKPSTVMELHRLTAPDRVPVYVIPYQYDSTIGVNLPAGQGTAYAVTANLDGCSLSVSGDSRSPLVSHSNVFQTPDFSKASMLSVRLQMLDVVAQTRGIQGGVTTSQPARLESYVDHAATGITHVDYGRNVVSQAGNALAQIRVHGQTAQTLYQNHLTSYTELVYKPARGEVSQLFSGHAGGDLTMIGERHGGIWRFYFQHSTVLGFDVWEVTRQRLTRTELSRVQRAGRSYCNVILNSGEFWPNRSDHPEAF